MILPYFAYKLLNDQSTSQQPNKQQLTDYQKELLALEQARLQSQNGKSGHDKGKLQYQQQQLER